ncbi:MAG: TonB-dependent receptor domain-containing protein [Pseudomonadota bacterium]
MGGAINIVSARPEFANSGWIRLRYDIETEGKQVQTMTNVALSDGVAMRLSAEGVHQDGGFFYNPNNDVYFDRQKGYGVRGQVRVQTGPLDLILLAETQDMTIPGIHYQVAIAKGTPGFPGGFTQPKFTYAWNTRPRASQAVDTYQVLGTLDLGGATLTSTTHYRVRNSQYDLDNDGIDAASLAAARASGAAVVNIDTNGASYVVDETKSLYQDVHLSGSAADGALDWLVGGDAVILDSRYQITTTRTPTLANPSTGTLAPAVLKFRSYAAYGSLGYDITDALNLTGELRYTTDDRSLSARLFDLGTGAAVGGAARVVDARTRPDNVSYNATLSYKFGGGVLGYAKMGSSYRAGGFNSNLGDIRQPITIPAAYDNESATSYELGLRGEPARNLYFAVAGYYNDLTDLIAQTDNGCAITLPSCPVAATSFLTNAGDARSYGVEAELSNTLPVYRGQFRFALAASVQGGKVTSGKFVNLRLPQVPEFLGSANLTFRRELGGDTKGFVNLLYTVQLGGVQELSATSVKLSDYDLLNLRVGIETGPFTIAVVADNITDQVYNIARNSTINRYSTPRTTRIEASYRF